MVTYYGLYINGMIKAVFSSVYNYHKWIKVIYKPMYKSEKVEFTIVELQGLIEDDNYSIYLLITEEGKKTDNIFVSTMIELKEEISQKTKTADRLVGIRIIIDMPYIEGCLKEGIIYQQ